MSIEMADYLSVVAPDVADILDIDPQGELIIDLDENQVVNTTDGGAEEVFEHPGGPAFTVTIAWEYLSQADATTVWALYFTLTKANGLDSSFSWVHPTDGNTYVVKFETVYYVDQNPADFYNMQPFSMRVLGVVS